MSKLIPRKIKKACKAYRNDVRLKRTVVAQRHTQTREIEKGKINIIRNSHCYVF